MAERDTLMSTLPEEVRDAADKVYREHGADPRDVVAELHKRGLLRDDQLRDALIALEASLRIARVLDRPPPRGSTTVLGPLGAGAMGEVLLAKDDGLNRVIAVKRLLPALAAKPAVLARFYKEAQITAQLDHPSIVPIHGLVDTGDGALAYGMKLVRGVTLEDFLDEAREQLRKAGAEDVEHALPARLERFLHVCDAMAYAHERGVVHRDLKPENVMVGTHGQVLVMDWGIAKLVDKPEERTGETAEISPHKAHGTRIGAVFGTPRYMSPEQAEGKNDVLDARSDQYALGLILQELVTLRPAISNDLDLEGCLAWAKVGRRQPMTHVHRKGLVPRELVAIVDKACEKNPDRRYANVTELADDVRRYLRDEAVKARPDTMVQRLQRWVGRHRNLVVFTILALLLLVVITASTLFVGSVTVIEWRRRVAAVHEEALAGLLSEANTQAAAIDSKARMVESLLTGLSFAAESSLDRPKGEIELPFDPVTEGPVLENGRYYRRNVAVDRPSIGLAKGVDAEAERDTIEKLVVLAYQFARVQADSTGRPSEKLKKKQRHELVADQGVPVVWARVGTADGLLASMPGLGPPKTVSDFRKAPWYLSPRGKSGPAWTGPVIDPDGMGLVMTVALPLSNHKAEWLGVASADLTLDALIPELSPPKGMDRAFLVDGEGRAVAWPGLAARDASKLETRPLDPALAAAIAREPRGWRESGGEVAVWSRVESLGLTWLAQGDDAVLGSAR